MKPLLASLLTLCLLAACGPTLIPAPPPTPAIIPDTNLDQLQPDAAVFRNGLVQSAQPILTQMNSASVYRIEFNLADDLTHVTGKENVRYTNQKTAPLRQVDFRLFPNILGGKMTVTGVLAYSGGVLTLAHAYPEIPIYDEHGWHTEIPPQWGDLTFNDAAFYLVTVRAPRDVTLVGTGVESAREMASGQVVQYVAAGPARDFFLAASRDFQVQLQTVGEVTVNSYAPASLRAGSRSALESAVCAIETFSREYGTYPYTELDLVATPTLAYGVEYPGVTAIAQRLYTDAAYADDTAIIREATVVHEAAHQWFYNLLGNDQLNEPWLDESLAQFAALEYFRARYGEGAARGFAASLEERWASVNDAPIPIGRPVASYTSQEYSAIVYGRGGLFLEALHKEMGAETFDAFLKNYTQTFAWKIATTEEFKSLAEKDCRCNPPLFKEWVSP